MAKPRPAAAAGRKSGNKPKGKPTAKANKPNTANKADSKNDANASSSPDNPTRLHQQRTLPFALQQRLLDVFRSALGPTLASPHFDSALQAVKRALYERDFATAFQQEQQQQQQQQPDAIPADTPPSSNSSSSSSLAPINSVDTLSPPPLDVYAARWSPTRALCYAAILASPLIQQHWTRKVSTATAPSQPTSTPIPPTPSPTTTSPPPTTTSHAVKDANATAVSTDTPASTTSATSTLRMFAIGGGAAEAVAFGALLAGLAGKDGLLEEDCAGDLTLLDAGPWESVVDRLHQAMTATTSSSKATTALVSDSHRWSIATRQLDILAVDDALLSTLVGSTSSTPTLVTLFFTLNELFTAGGIGNTAAFLLRLTAVASPGTLLLVVDSPGSYAEASLGSQARRYPMRWLVDRILLEDATPVSSDGDGNGNGNGNTAWSKLHQDEAVWFRLPSALSYPIRLEDMRYQIHLYVRK